jgi:REP element-mobilizing transposase RayT
MPQSLSQLWTHIIFSTKNRYPFLKEDSLQKHMHDFVKFICEKHHCYCMAVGGTEDHIHLLVSLHKTLSLSRLIEEIKIASSKWIKTLANSENSLDQFYWQRGYGAFSVSQSNAERVKLYIQHQRHHHAQYSFQDELRKLFIQHNIQFDEKYLWD